MSTKVAKKIGFWAAVAMIIGTIIGVGVFFKNGSIFRSVDGNGISALIVWILGGTVSVFAAISFSEIGTTNGLSISGYSGWAEKVGGKKFGYLIRFNYTFFYYGLFTSIYGIFVSEAFFQAFDVLGILDNPAIWVHFLGGALFVGISILTSVKSIYASGVVQQITTVIKLIPLVLAIILGLAMANTHHSSNGQQVFTHGDFNFSGIVAAIPAVLFAFDAFLNASALGAKTKGGEVTVRKAIVVGVIASAVLYILLALSSVFHTGVDGGKIDGTVEFLFKDTIGQDWVTAMIWFFITISAYGVQNGLSTSYVSNVENMMQKDTFVGQKKLISKFGIRKSVVIFIISLTTFWMTVVAAITIPLNTGAIVDALSSLPTIYFFFSYAIVILLYTLKRDKIDSSKMNNTAFKVCAWSAIVGIFLIYGYLIVWTYFGDVIAHPMSDTSFGLWDNGGDYSLIKNYQFCLIFWGTLLILGFITWLNQYVMKRHEKINPIK